MSRLFRSARAAHPPTGWRRGASCDGPRQSVSGAGHRRQRATRRRRRCARCCLHRRRGEGMNAVGMCAAVFGDLLLTDTCDQVPSAGFNVIDLPTDSPFRTLRGWWDGALSCPQICRELDARGIEVACVSNSRDSLLLLGPFGQHTDAVRAGTPEEKRAHGRDAALRAIDLASELGAPLVRLAFGCPDFSLWLEWQGSDVAWPDNVETFAKEAREVIERARAHGVRSCVESEPLAHRVRLRVRGDVAA